jgi:GT2 family glycosyltransferase
VFQEAGGFDESTFLYEEELILAERLRSVGSFFVLSKGCRYFHEEARSTRLIPYRRRLHFINSEQYLLREYYKRNATLRLALRVWRYLEWTTYALSWKFRPSSSPTPVAHQRGLGHLAQDGPKPAERGRS